MPKIKKIRKVEIGDEYRDFNYSICPDGRWLVRINTGEISGYSDSGKPRYKYKHIHAKGELEMRQKIMAYFAGEEEIKKSKEILETDIKNWLKIRYWKETSGRTYDRAEQAVDYILLPEIRKLRHSRVVDITVEDCNTILKNIKIEKGQNAYKKASVLLKAYFEYKVETDVIEKNPVRLQKVRTTKDRVASNTKRKYLTDDEIVRMKNIIENGYTYHAKSRTGNVYSQEGKIPQGKFFIFMLNTGIRTGEACALKYSDIDFENNLMTINSNITMVKKRDEDGNAIGGYERVSNVPKTAESNATIRINQKAIDILKEMLKDEPEGYNSYIVHDLRPESENHIPQEGLNPNALYKRWKTLCKYAEIEPIGLHSLRHTCASYLFEKTNGNALLVSKTLRHSSVSFTEDVYIDIIQKYENRIFEDFEI